MLYFRTMNVTLKPDLERFITEKTRTGQFADASDVVNEALELLRDQEQFSPDREAYLRREVKRGLDQLDQGQFSAVTTDQIIAQERVRLASQQDKD
jgi:antitoxin ParD1/3/4